MAENTCTGSGEVPTKVIARHINEHTPSGAPFDRRRPTGAGVCPACGQERSLRLDGSLAKHAVPKPKVEPRVITDGEAVVACTVCGEWFVVLPIQTSCTVAHAPGTCCHYGQEPVGGRSIVLTPKPFLGPLAGGSA